MMPLFSDGVVIRRCLPFLKMSPIFWKARSGIKNCGFSLVEITLAIGIFSFCVLAIVGLLSVALNSSKESQRDSATISILRYVDAELRKESAKDASQAPAVQALYFDLVGKPADPIDEEDSDTIFKATVERVGPAGVNQGLQDAMNPTAVVGITAKPLFLWSVTLSPSRAKAGSVEEKKYLLGHTAY
jgi:uncharacterized protein (TIGR02598 family)